MSRKTISAIITAMLLTSTLTLALNIQPVKAIGTIYIRADGSIDPPTAPIQRNGDIYTLTGNIACDTNGIKVERNYVTIDGNGFMLQGAGGGDGIRLWGREGVTIRNIQIKAFFQGIYLDSSSNNIISGNSITTITGLAFWLYSSCNYNIISGNNIADSGHGIWLYSSSYNSISGNTITTIYGISIYAVSCNYNSITGNNIANNGNAIRLKLSSGNTIYHNNFIDNSQQVVIEDSGSINSWDDGYPSGGNYWSDYTTKYPSAHERDDSGIWDTPYVIDANNQDHYPLVNPWTPAGCGRPVLTASLIISSEVGYIVGATINARFTVRNDGDAAIKLDKLGVGGRFNGGTLPNGLFPDFTFQTVTLQPGESHQYSGRLDLTEAGDYHFFVAYYMTNPTEEEKKLLDPNNWNTCIDLAPGLTDNDRILNRNIQGRAPVPQAIPIMGKGIWIWKIWEEGSLDDIISRLESAKVRWVAIKCGDSNAYYLREGAHLLPDWANNYGGFPKVIERFHKKGISVLGIHYVNSTSNWKDLPDVTELDVANEILNIPGIDGLLINAENDTMQAAIDNYGTYLMGLRSTHPNDFIAYNSYDSAPPEWKFRVALHSTFTTYCNASMPEVYWTVSGRTPTQALSYMEGPNGIGKLVQGKLVDRWHEKPLMPMGISGPASDLGSREILAGEITEFCDTSFAHGYSVVSLYAYHIMHEDWKWTEYSGCFNPDTTIRGQCPIDLVVTDPDGLIISKGLNEVPGALYAEFDSEGNNDTAIEVSILHRKLGDYFIAVKPQLNASSNATYSLDISMYNLTTVLAENVSICDIPPELYAVTLTETSIVPRIAAHDIGIKRFSAFKIVLGQNQVVGFDVTVLNYGDYEEHFNFTAYVNSSIVADLVNITLTSRDCFSTTFQWNTTGFARGNYTVWAYAEPVQGETYTADNNFTGGWVVVSMVGDLTGGGHSVWDFVPDGSVDGSDLIVVAMCFGSWPGAPPPYRWNANCDITNDGFIDGSDLIIVARYFGQTSP